MDKKLRVGLFNDSFPPMIDGVAQVVKNYAQVMQEQGLAPTVVTPAYRGVKDHYPFPVYRYQSINVGRSIGYRAGNPLDPVIIHDLRAEHFDIVHIHAPFSSSLLAQNIDPRHKVPHILTYHTKFDVDIRRRLPVGLQRTALKFMLHNIKQADEVWAVTNACGDALRDVGYKGSFRVMENGTDFAFGRSSAEEIEVTRQQYLIPDDRLTFLFVGRMMWYKNIRLILDALRFVRDKGLAFTAVFVGDGLDAADIRRYARENGLGDCTIFTGAVYDRERLRVFYSLADLFLFPSTFDTSGIVVKEAAACECPSLLIAGSCAAEGSVDRFTAFHAEENARSCAQAILSACHTTGLLKTVGQNAGRHLYLPWDVAVGRAVSRYRELLSR